MLNGVRQKRYRWLLRSSAILCLAVVCGCAMHGGTPSTPSPSDDYATLTKTGGVVKNKSIPLPSKYARNSESIKLDNCNIYAQVKHLGATRDSIRWLTPGGSQWCQARVVQIPDVKVWGYRLFETSGPYFSHWYDYDSRRDVSVCVTNQAGEGACSGHEE